MTQQEQLLDRMNEFDAMLMKQDRIVCEILELFKEYRRNHQEIYKLQQQLRPLLNIVKDQC